MEVKSWHIRGGILVIMWTCKNGHSDYWISPKVLCKKKRQKVFVNIMLMAAAVFIISKNFEKIGALFQFLGTGVLSASTLYRVQKNYVVLSLWEEIKQEVWAVLNESLILCGVAEVCPLYFLTNVAHMYKCSRGGRTLVKKKFLSIVEANPPGRA